MSIRYGLKTLPLPPEAGALADAGPAPSLITHPNGDREWLLRNRRHRIDGPAVENANGDREWWVNGASHRSDGPSVERANGSREWWLNGMLHRVDGPAVQREDGHQEWWVRGQLHRIGGPAIVTPGGTKTWYAHYRIHRTDGPAIETPYSRSFWLHGVDYAWQFNAMLWQRRAFRTAVLQAYDPIEQRKIALREICKLPRHIRVAAIGDALLSTDPDLVEWAHKAIARGALNPDCTKRPGLRNRPPAVGTRAPRVATAEKKGSRLPRSSSR